MKYLTAIVFAAMTNFLAAQTAAPAKTTPDLSDFELAPQKAPTAEFQRQLADANTRAIEQFPAAGQKGTVLYEWIEEDVAIKKKSDPAFFQNPNWPWNITCEAVREFKAKAWADQTFEDFGNVSSKILTAMTYAAKAGWNKETDFPIQDGIKQRGLILDQIKGDKQHLNDLRTDDRAQFQRDIGKLSDEYLRQFVALRESLLVQNAQNAERLAQAEQSIQDMLNAGQQTKSTQDPDPGYWDRWRNNRIQKQHMDDLQQQIDDLRKR